MSDHLFPVAPSARDEVTPRAKAEPPETFPVLVDEAWRCVTKLQPGVVHARILDQRQTFKVMTAKRIEPRGGTVVSWCGRVVVPQTFTDGDVVQGCAACRRAGAPT